MAAILQFRRMITSALSVVVPRQGELLVNSDDLTLRLGTGVTPAGIVVGGRLPKIIVPNPYPIVPEDQGRTLIFDQTITVNVTVPQPLPQNNWMAGAFFDAYNYGLATVHFGAIGSTINESADFFLPPTKNVRMISDGERWWALLNGPT